MRGGGGAANHRRPFRSAATASLAGVCTVLLAACGGAASPPGGNAPPYLALGDSITFGWVDLQPTSSNPNPYADAARFVAYPSDVGSALHLTAVNVACPGETSGSLIDLRAPDNGCHTYRSAFPLHVQYTGQSQLQFAGAFLRTHHTTKLVSIGIGANDGLLLLTRCGGLSSIACVESHLSAVIGTLSANLTAIVQSLRATGYRGPIVLVNYYSLNYADATETSLVSALDSAVATVAASQNLRVADAFTAFKNAAPPNGDVCASGLLEPGSSRLGACDLHPTASGQQLIAMAVERAARG